MAVIDSKYVPLSTIQEQFWDKLNDCPLSGGIITFYKDNQRTIKKPVYQITGDAEDYSFIPMRNPIVLSSIGTFFDPSGNNVVPYLYPYDDSGKTNAENIELYYITVQSSDGQFQFSVSACPYIVPQGVTGEQDIPPNLITNGQFLQQYKWGNSSNISQLDTEIAYDGWHYTTSDNVSTDTVQFANLGIINSPILNPTGNPRYACRISSNNQTIVSYKRLEIRFKDVNRLSDPNQEYTLFFSSLNNKFGEVIVNASLYKFFGTPNGSIVDPVQINLEPIIINGSWSNSSLSFKFGSNYGNTLGTNGDDYFAIRIELPINGSFDLSFTDFALFVGNLNITEYPFTINPIEPYSVNNSLVINPTVQETVPPTQNQLSSVLKQLFVVANGPFSVIKTNVITTSGTYYPSDEMLYCIAECWGGGGAGGGCVGSDSDMKYQAAGGGGAGSYSISVFSKEQFGASRPITIGAGGTGQFSGNGNPGGLTYIGTNDAPLMRATGGDGALYATNPTLFGQPPFVSEGALGGLIGGHSGVNPAIGDIVTPGSNGSSGMVAAGSNSQSNVFSACGGAGGNTLVGAGGKSPIENYSASRNGENGRGFGSGGSGAVWRYQLPGNSKGGDGASGVVIITEFCSNTVPAPTVTYNLVDNENDYLIDNQNNYLIA